MKLVNFKLSLAACMAAIFSVTIAADVSAQTVERLSVASDGTQANGSSTYGDMSPDGRYTVFMSGATNLVSGITAQSQIYLRDRTLGTTEVISVSESGAPSNYYASYPKVSDNGRYVVFSSAATNLVPGANNYKTQIYLRDRIDNITVLISKTVSGGPATVSCETQPGISADGRYVVYACASNNLVADDTNNLSDIFVYDRMTSQTQRVSVSSAGTPANNHSRNTALVSADGRYVAFYSSASNLVDNDINNVDDVFVHDRQNGTTKMVSVSSEGIQGNAKSSFLLGDITPDGRFIAFMTDATNLGSGDTLGLRGVFVHDQYTGTTELASHGHYPALFPKLSDDGRYVAFSANGHTYVRDRQNGVTQNVLEGSYYPDHSYVNGVSATGRYFLVHSDRPDLIPGDTNSAYDVFIVDTGNTCQY